MFWWDKSQVEGWLTSIGAVRLGDDSWEFEGETLDSNGMIHATEHLMYGDRPDYIWDREELNLGLGMFDLFDDYANGMYLPFTEFLSDGTRVDDVVIEFCREVLGREREWEGVTYWIAMDVFESEKGDEWFRRLVGDTRVEAFSEVENFRRVSRVLECSTAVDWAVKEPILNELTLVPALHKAIFSALLFAYHGYFGQIDRRPALRLLGELNLESETEHFETLKAVLAAGHRHHTLSPNAWRAAGGD